MTYTVKSGDTLSKIAGAMELALSQFFAESGHSNGNKGLPQLSDDEVRFLSQIRRYSVSLNDSDRHRASQPVSLTTRGRLPARRR